MHQIFNIKTILTAIMERIHIKTVKFSEYILINPSFGNVQVDWLLSSMCKWLEIRFAYI